MIKNKRNAQLYGMIIGIILRIGVGLSLENIAVGMGLGVAYRAVIGRMLSGEEMVKDKEKALVDNVKRQHPRMPCIRVSSGRPRDGYYSRDRV